MIEERENKIAEVAVDTRSAYAPYSKIERGNSLVASVLSENHVRAGSLNGQKGAMNLSKNEVVDDEGVKGQKFDSTPP